MYVCMYVCMCVYIYIYIYIKPISGGEDTEVEGRQEPKKERRLGVLPSAPKKPPNKRGLRPSTRAYHFRASC